MDRYEVTLATLGHHEIHSYLQEAEDPDRLTSLWVSADVKNPGTYEKADVIFLPYGLEQDKFQEVLRQKAPYASVIFLCDSLPTVRNQIFEEFELWLMDPFLLRHHVVNLKRQLLTKLDLALSTNQLDTLIDSVPDLIWYKDARGSHIKVNESFCKTVNKTKDQIRYRGHCYIWDLAPEEYEQGEYVCMETEDVVLEEQKTFLFDEKVKISDEMRQQKTYKSAIVGRNGESLGTVGIARDVTEIWNTHEEFRTLINRLPLAMMILDSNYGLLSENERFQEIFHFSQEDHKNFDIKTFASTLFNAEITFPSEENHSEEYKTLLDGQIHHFIVEKSGIHDVFGELSGYFYIFRNVSKTRKYEEKLRMLAETDELTHLNNRKAIRRFLEEKLPELSGPESKFTLAMMDIDYFKRYNDHYGHLEGDQILRIIGEILNDHSDNEQVLAARFGGEEFMILVLNQPESQSLALVEAIQEDLAQRALPHQESLVDSVVTLSIGLVQGGQFSADSELSHWIEKADKALYQAKNQGRNQLCIYKPS